MALEPIEPVREISNSDTSWGAGCGVGGGGGRGVAGV